LTRLGLAHQDLQDYQEFFACGEGLSAEGRIILTILLILSNYFFKKKNPFLFFKLIVSYLIRLDARGQRLDCLPCVAFMAKRGHLKPYMKPYMKS